MGWAAVGQAAASAIGSYLANKKKARELKPADVTTGMGTANWGKHGYDVETSLSDAQQAWSNRFQSMGLGLLGGKGPTADFQNFAMGDVQGMFPSLFLDQINASGVDQGALNSYLSQLNGLGGGMTDLYGAAGNAGMNALNGPMIGANQANTMFGMGQSMMNQPQQSYQDVFNQRLGLLREQAAPAEQRAQDSFLNRMYSMGQMGNHTGGQRSIESFARGLAQADTTRQLDAMNVSEALYGRDQQAALQRQGMGAGLMGQGMGGLLSGYGTQMGAAQGLLGLSGQLGQGAAGMYGSGFGASMTFNDLVNSRAQQRMANASELFGFGNQLGQQDLATAIGLNNQQMQQQQMLLDQARLGLSAGAIRLGATQDQAQGANAGGGFLSGLMGSMGGSGGGGMFGGMMGGGGGTGTSGTAWNSGSAWGSFGGGMMGK